MSRNKKPLKFIVVVMLAVLAIAALAGVVGAILSMVTSDDAQPELTEAAQPYQQDLAQAAQQCPTVLTPQRLDRYINDSTGWDADYESPTLVTVSVAGMPEEAWEHAGGGDPNDVPTAIRNIASQWCAHSTTLAGEDIDFDYDLPVPANADDDPRSAALGLAAIFMGADNVRSGNVSVSDVPSVEQAMKAVL